MERTIQIKEFIPRLANLLGVEVGQSFRICGTGLGLWYKIQYNTILVYNSYEDVWGETHLTLAEFVELVAKNGITINDELKNGDTIYIPNFGVAKGYNKYTYNENDPVCQRLKRAGMLFDNTREAVEFVAKIVADKRIELEDSDEGENK